MLVYLRLSFWVFYSIQFPRSLRRLRLNWCPPKGLCRRWKTKFKDSVGAVLDDAGRLKLDVKGKILFETGKATLSSEGEALLDAIAEEVLLNTNYVDYAVRVEGHTDDAPIGGSELRNWNLSTERAIAAVKYLQEHVGIEAQRLAVTGYAFYQPIDAADTPEAKAKNRRIEIILVPPQDFLSELLTSLQNVMESIVQ